MWKALLAIATAISIGATAKAESVPRGVSIALASQYHPQHNGEFLCLDGQKSIQYSAINDDYCDCADGSDEPGTSACPTAFFNCANVGHVPGLLAASRVNDGVCDWDVCCDGSDEFDSGLGCTNVCERAAELAKVKSVKSLKESFEGALRKREYLVRKAVADDDRDLRVRELEAEVDDFNMQIRAWNKVMEFLNRRAENALRRNESLSTERDDDSDVKRECEAEIIAFQEAHETAKEKVTSLQSNLDSNLNKIEEYKQKLDFGPDGSLGVLSESCLEYDTPEYTYKLCFFSEAKQIMKSGGETNLGSWEGFTGPDLTKFSGKDLKYTEAKFSNGVQCWNGPARSLVVSLECGVRNEIVSVSEPAKCEYYAWVITVALCEIEESDIEKLDEIVGSREETAKILHDEL
ncbi:hypothetical protein HK100_000535 [Physocladia obscura]|uniref:Glucosidase 2 subunit beta n=1 Tax=Physocladia obscura TaxID=109957 RepID=A0AAD5XF56_9FUNG|nr:hypothetical protein HK100_000535 [Physocladia obscura]